MRRDKSAKRQRFADDLARRDAISGTSPGKPRENALQRLSRSSDSVTVSYRSSGGWYATCVGYGASVQERVADADKQLPPGEWTRECVSTPVSVYTDLCGRPVLPDHGEGSRAKRRAYHYEYQVVNR